MTKAQPIRGYAAGTSYLRRQGDGDSLVLLHGIGSDAESWLPLIDALSPTIDVIAWDAPGYGASEPLAPFAPTPADYAARVADLLDAMHLGRVVLAGHSLGSLFAAGFTVAYPSRVAALALLSPAIGYGVGPGAPLPEAVQARIDDLERLGSAAFAARRAARLVYRSADKPEVLAGVRRGMANVRLAGYAQAVRALGAGTLLADAAAILAPTLVAVGAEDIVTPPENARSVHAVLPAKLPMHIVPDAGHALPQEQPAAVARLLANLMQGQTDV